MKKVSVVGPMYSHLGNAASPSALAAGHTLLAAKPMPGTAEYDDNKQLKDQKISGNGLGRSGGGGVVSGQVGK